MASNISFLCLIFFTFAAFDVGQAFDYFELVQRWIPARCRTERVTCRVATIPERFGIHGLWPGNQKGRSQRPSPNDPAYVTISPLGELYNEMMSEWPDVEKDPSIQEFWRYQWDVHGKITSSMYTQLQYFERAVELVKRFPVRDWLTYRNIYANDGVPEYTAQNISLAISAQTLKEPELRCDMNLNGKFEPKFELKEIIICVNLAGSVIDCPRPSKNCFQKDVSFLL